MARLTEKQRDALREKGEDTHLIQRRNQLDSDSQAMIYDGCNLTQLTKIFGVDRRTLEEKLRHVAPAGQRGGYPIYHIREVAGHLVKPVYDVDTYIRRMKPSDLPPALSKEFWAGQKARQDFLLKEGELWPTSEVIKAVNLLLKTLRMNWLLTRDAIERDMVLSESQRASMVRHMDGGLMNAAAAVEEEFKIELKNESDEDI